MLVGSSSTFWMRPVRPLDDAQFLFELLNERDPRANISHKKMPTYTSHVNFIKSKPYKKWYIVFVVRKLSGKNNPTSKYQKIKSASVYLSKNDEIGIFVLKKFHRIGVGDFALSEIIKRNPRKRYLANVSPKNKKSMGFFKSNGFKHIQQTFELTKKP